MFDVLVVGAGEVGTGIAQAISLSGRSVVLMDDTVSRVEGLTVTPYTVTGVAADGGVSVTKGNKAATLQFEIVIIAAGKRTSEIIDLTEKATRDSLKIEQMSPNVVLVIGAAEHAGEAAKTIARKLL